MKDLNKHIDLIERYLDEDLDQQEMAEFNHLLNTDKEFNRLFFEMDRLVEGIRVSARQTEIEEKLARLEQALPVKKKYVQNQKSQSIFTRIVETINHYLDRAIATVFNLDREEMVAVPVDARGQASGWAIASRIKVGVVTAISILIIASILIFSPMLNPPMSASKLFAENFEPFPNVGGGIKRGENDIEKLQSALLAYDNGDYQSTIEIIEEIQVQKENQTAIWMYGGNAYLATGNTEKAIQMFKNIINDDTGFTIQAKWYLSLSYLKAGDLASARGLLSEIKDTGKYKNEEAAEILEKLEELEE